MTKFQKAVKAVFSDKQEFAPIVHPDKIICHRDGSVSLKRSYFYRSGQTAKGWADKVMADLVCFGVPITLVRFRDEYKSWPQDSWFSVTVKEQGA